MSVVPSCVGCGDDSGGQAGAANAVSSVSSGSSGGGAGAGAGGGGSGAAGGCVDVSHVDARQRDDLEVTGTGFEAYEGHTVRILVTLGEPTYGLGEAPIREGSFDIFLPGVLGDYTGIAVHIDTVRDNACNPEKEFIWQQTTGPASAWGPHFAEIGGRVVWEVTPDTLMVFPQAGVCNLNGIFDMTSPLSCTD